MTYITNSKLSLNDTYLDAFGRLHTSSPYKIFEYFGEYGDLGNKYDTVTAGTASISTTDNYRTINLNVGTAQGDKCLRQSSRYMRYIPGQEMEILMTGVLGTAKTGVESRIGYYDATDGFYFAQTAQGPAVVKRSSSTNQIIYVYQSQWNQDKLDGTGKSNITLDLSKTHIFKLTFQFLGVGCINFSYIINGEEILVHKMYHANIESTIYMMSPNLPIRYEIENLTATSSSTSMKQICSSVTQSGNPDTDGKLFNIDSGASKDCIVGAWKPILSISLGDLLNGYKYKGFYNINHSQLVTTNGKIAAYKLILNGTLTGPSWVHVSTNKSAMKYDKTATAISGGSILHGGYIIANNTTTIDFSSYPQIARTFYSKPYTAQDTLTIVAQGLEFTSAVVANLNWFESQ